MLTRSPRWTTLAVALLFLASCTTPPSLAGGDATSRIRNIVVIYAENRSFDHLYGLFPGAEGIADAKPEQFLQVDQDGKVLPQLPPVWTADGKPDPRFPPTLPNKPFRIDAPPIGGTYDKVLPNPIHAFWHNQEQIAGGLNNRFVASGNTGGWVMGYWDGSRMELWKWAKDFTLADHFFMGAYGGSFLNHFWLVCACTPQFPNAPASITAQVEPDGKLKRRPNSPASVMMGPMRVFDGQVTPDGYAVNTLQPTYQPSGTAPAAGGDANLADPARNPLPPQRQKTIGDTLSAKNVTWAWYAGGWNAATSDGRQDPQAKRAIIYNREPPSPIFQAHHQPFNYFARFAPGTPDRARHLKDYDDLVKDIDAGTLPQVAFYKPAGRDTQHPGYTDISTGDRHMGELLARLRRSPQWDRMLIVVTYDENGGYWDHVPPPSGPGWSDRWGPGTRVPAIIMSPFAKKGYVDKTPYDTTSLLKLITRRFDLEPLPGVRANVGDLSNAIEAGN